jgi:DNA-binding NtrC family response regulator
VTPVGSSTARPIDVRVVAATHRDLRREVNAGRFRADLFYRMAVVRLRVPSLRERLDDLPMLANAFLAALRPRYGDALPSELSALTLARLAAQPWPGNVRELRNAVERVALLAVDAPGAAVAAPAYVELRDRFLADFDRRYLLRALERCDFNVTRAAQATGLTRTYFQRLLSKNGISAAELRRR